MRVRMRITRGVASLGVARVVVVLCGIEFMCFVVLVALVVLVCGGVLAR